MVHETTLPDQFLKKQAQIVHVACQVEHSALGLRCIRSLAVISLFRTHPLPRPGQGEGASPNPGLEHTWWAGLLSGVGGPQALLLHDVPELAQVGLCDGVIWLQLQCSQVVGFGLVQFTIKV